MDAKEEIAKTQKLETIGKAECNETAAENYITTAKDNTVPESESEVQSASKQTDKEPLPKQDAPLIPEPSKAPQSLESPAGDAGKSIPPSDVENLHVKELPAK